MASSSAFNFSAAVRANGTPSGLSCEKDLSAYDRVASTRIRTRPSLSMRSPGPWLETQKQLACDPQAGLIISRFRNAIVVSGFAVAATTVLGLSSFHTDCFAIASELGVNNSTVVADMNDSDQGTSARRNRNGNTDLYLALDPSIISDSASRLSFSLAIPIPHEQEWIIVSNGHVAPLHQTQTQEASGLKCPPWTPSELEMVLPDFNGRPKPFPRKGSHWFASITGNKLYSDAILQLAGLSGEDVQSQSMESNYSPVEIKLDLRENNEKEKMMAMDRSTCFRL